jgi:3-oxoacyl-[acyl-carrier protein] reductase
LTDFTVDLNGKAAIVTGAGAGVGRAIALALGRAGAAVVVNDLNPDRVQRVKQELISQGGKALGVQGDVCNRFQAATVIEKAREEFSAIHILVNAAGVYKSGDMIGVDEWDWRRQIDVNLTGAFFCSQLLSRVMIDEHIPGVIVNIAAATWNATLPTGVGYIASKAGMVGMTHQIARELAPSGIRVNAVCPGNIEGDDVHVDVQNMLGIGGIPDEVANTVLFLCSDAARFIVGQAIYVDGGRLT